MIAVHSTKILILYPYSIRSFILSYINYVAQLSRLTVIKKIIIIISHTSHSSRQGNIGIVFLREKTSAMSARFVATALAPIHLRETCCPLVLHAKAEQACASFRTLSFPTKSKNIGELENTPSSVWKNYVLYPPKNKHHNDRIGKIYRFNNGRTDFN